MIYKIIYKLLKFFKIIYVPARTILELEQDLNCNWLFNDGVIDANGHRITVKFTLLNSGTIYQDQYGSKV